MSIEMYLLARDVTRWGSIGSLLLVALFATFPFYAVDWHLLYFRVWGAQLAVAEPILVFIPFGFACDIILGALRHHRPEWYILNFEDLENE